MVDILFFMWLLLLILIILKLKNKRKMKLELIKETEVDGKIWYKVVKNGSTERAYRDPLLAKEYYEQLKIKQAALFEILESIEIPDK